MTTLLLETIHPDAQSLLAEHGPVVLAASPTEPGPAVLLEEVAAILTRGRGKISRTLIERCPHLRVVARCGVGLDNIDVQAAADQNVAVVYAPGSTTTAVAEQTLLFILALVRDLYPLATAVKQGNWASRDGYVATMCWA
ncbi:MAG: hypothetical protein HC802_08545 [Caldilineaceae bacterium]|nr:hypothetical protein [Caldilineaceae bacterium]